MIESPLIQELRADLLHDAILEVLKDRFGSVPRDISKRLRAILDEKKLKKLTVAAARCADLAAYHEALLA
jgi:hypothetical protein